MHCMAGLDRPDRAAGRDRRRRARRAERQEADQAAPRRGSGFVFQAFNLVPTLTARENITLPLDIAGRKADQEWFDTVIDTVGLRDRLSHRPTSSPAGSSSGWPAPAPWSAGPTIVFADEPTGNLDCRASAEILGFLRRSVDEFGQTDRHGHARPGRRGLRRPRRCSSPTAGSSTSCDDPTADSRARADEGLRARGAAELTHAPRHAARGARSRPALPAHHAWPYPGRRLRRRDLRPHRQHQRHLRQRCSSRAARASTCRSAARRRAERRQGDQPVREQLPLTLADTLRSVDGVQRVGARHPGHARSSWARTGRRCAAAERRPVLPVPPRRPSLHLVQGAAPPRRRARSAVESSTLKLSGLNVGDRTHAVIGGQRRARSPSSARSFDVGLAGATVVAVDEQTASSEFAPDGTVPSFSVQATPGHDKRSCATASPRSCPPRRGRDRRRR